MTGKLIKYEMKSSIRFIAIIWAAVGVISVFAGIFMRLASDAMSDYFYEYGSAKLIAASAQTINVITMILYVALLVAMTVASLIIIVSRFYKGILGNEGYLTNTLPVTTRQILVSRGLTAGILLLISTIVGVVSVAIVVIIDSPEYVMENIRNLFDVIIDNPWLIVVIFEFLILMIVSTLSSVYQVYVSLSVGQLVDKHRILLSIGTYIGINFILSTISSIFFVGGGMTGALDKILDMLSNVQPFAASQMMIIPLMLFNLILLFVFHVVSEKLLKSHLNLL